MERFRRQKVDVSKLPAQVLEKWSRSILDEGFVPFPKKFVRCLHLLFTTVEGIKELAVILAIADFKRPNLSRMPSVEYLAFLAGLDLDDFNNILKALERKGYIRVTPDGEGVDVSFEGLFKEIEKRTAEDN